MDGRECRRKYGKSEDGVGRRWKSFSGQWKKEKSGFIGRFDKDETFDATARTLHLWDMPALLLYINGLVDGDVLADSFNGNAVESSRRADRGARDDRFLTYFPYHSVTPAKDVDELLTSILSGQAAFVTPEGYAFTIDAQVLSWQATRRTR